MHKMPVNKKVSQKQEIVQCEDRSRKYFVEGSVAFFYPTSHLVREIYGTGSVEYSLEGDVRIAQVNKKGIYAWASSSYVEKVGHTALDNSTRFQLFSVGFGLKLFYLHEVSSFYFGLGALPSYLNTHNHSRYVLQVTHKWDWGGIVKSGVLIRLYKSLCLDVFLDYAYLCFHPVKTTDKALYYQSVSLSHLSSGGGLVWQF